MANVNVYKTQGGDELVIGADGTLRVEGTFDGTGATFNLGPDSITTAMIQANAVTTAKIANLNVTTGTINNLAVTTGKIAAGAVTKAKTAMFISGDTVGTGAPQNIAHGLGVDPTTANVFFSVISTAAAGDFAFTGLATDGTNITVTATNTITYRVMAWAP